MLRDGADGPGVDVRGRAHLQRNAPVAHECREPAQAYRPVRLDGDVVHDPDPVPEPLGSAELERLPDRRQPERFAGMDGDVEVLMADPVKRLEMSGRTVAGLRTGDIQTHHPRLWP